MLMGFMLLIVSSQVPRCLAVQFEKLSDIFHCPAANAMVWLYDTSVY